METSYNERIYFKRDVFFDRQNEILDDCQISAKNKELIRKYQDSLFSRAQCGRLRIGKLTLQLRIICLRAGTDLDTITKPEMEQLISKINRDENLSPASKSDYRKTIRQFYRWYKIEDARLEEIDLDKPKEEIKILQEKKKEAIKFYHYLENDVKTSYKLEEIDPALVITEEDLQIILDNGCKYTKDKAFVALLHELGARIGEFLNLKIRDVHFSNNVAELYLMGKTGRRTVYAHDSLPYLVKWLDVHPDKNNPDAYLWVSMDNRRFGKPMMHIGATRLIKRVLKKSGLKKKANVHWFRHSRASILATRLTEPLLRKYMGWSKDSTMIKHYGHFAQKDIKDAILATKGILQEDNNQPKPIICGLCNTSNPSNARYCYKCSKPLKVATILQDQELINEEISRRMKEMFLEFSKSPQLMKEFEKFKKTK